MKHRLIIHQVNGKIHGIYTSGETEVYLVSQGPGLDSVAQIQANEFRIGEAHDIFLGNAKQFLKDKKV